MPPGHKAPQKESHKTAPAAASDGKGTASTPAAPSNAAMLDLLGLGTPGRGGGDEDSDLLDLAGVGPKARMAAAPPPTGNGDDDGGQAPGGSAVDPRILDFLLSSGPANAAYVETQTEWHTGDGAETDKLCFHYAGELATAIDEKQDRGGARAALPFAARDLVPLGWQHPDSKNPSKDDAAKAKDATVGTLVIFGTGPDMHTATVVEAGDDPLVAESHAHAPKGRVVPLSQAQADIAKAVLKATEGRPPKDSEEQDVIDAKTGMMPVRFIRQSTLQQRALEVHSDPHRQAEHAEMDAVNDAESRQMRGQATAADLELIRRFHGNVLGRDDDDAAAPAATTTTTTTTARGNVTKAAPPKAAATGGNAGGPTAPSAGKGATSTGTTQKPAWNPSTKLR